MTRPLVTVLLGDPRLPDRSKPGGRYTADDLDQVVRLKSALDELSAYEFDYRDDHVRLLDDLRVRPPEFALNFCDTGYRNDASLELHVASYLEMLGIAYSGSGPVPLGLCYDKALVRALAQSVGIPVPREVFLRPGESLVDMQYPAFIKPNRGDGSFGISKDSVVQDRAQAEECVAKLREALPGDNLIVQEFLSGDEYGVGIIGNPARGFTILPVLEVDYSALDASLPRLLDYSSKTDPESPYWNDVHFREARLAMCDVGRLDETLDAAAGARRCSHAWACETTRASTSAPMPTAASSSWRSIPTRPGAGTASSPTWRA